jgi:hypothetical protein
MTYLDNNPGKDSNSVSNPIPTSDRPRRTSFGAALMAAFGLAVAMPPEAPAAGSYVNLSCTPGTLSIDSYGGWSSYNQAPAVGVFPADRCADPADGLHLEMHPAAGSSVPLYHGLGWTFTAPANTSITAFRGSMTGWVNPWDGRTRGLIEVRGSTDRLALLDSSSNTMLHPTPWAFKFAGLHDAAVQASVACDGAPGSPDCPGGSDTGWMAMRSIRISLADDAPPVPGATSGAAVADTTWKATKSLAYSATDQGGGVAAFRLYVDGVKTVDHVIDTFSGHCAVIGTDGADWVFGAPKPCPGGVNDTESVDSTAIADGEHTVTFKVVDASQREATLWTGARLIANHPPVNNVAPAYTAAANAGAPVTGVTLGATDGSWSGPSLSYARAWQQCDAAGANCVQIPGTSSGTYTPTAGDLGHRLRFAVTATNVAESVTAYSPLTGLVSTPSSNEPPTAKPTDGSNGAGGSSGANGSNAFGTIVVPGLQTTNTTKSEHVLIGHVAGEPAGTACPQDKATLVFQHIKSGQMKLGFGKSSTAQLQLTCTNNGKAIEGAKLEIATKTGSQPVVAADVTTDGSGHATLRLAKSASRGIAVGYRMYSDDPMARATATLKVLVPGKVDLKSSRTRLRNGGVVRLSGLVRGGLVPTRGVNLAVQWKDGGKWRPFAQIKTDRKGHFKYAYKFTRTPRTVVYRLRVRMASGQVDYPYMVASSKTVRVTVAP